MTVVGADRRDAERELLAYVIDEVDGMLLRVPRIEIQRPNKSCVVDARVLVAPHRLTGRAGEVEKLHIDLDVVTWHLFLVPLPELHSVLPDVAGQTVEAVALEHVSRAPEETLSPW